MRIYKLKPSDVPWQRDRPHMAHGTWHMAHGTWHMAHGRCRDNEHSIVSHSRMSLCVMFHRYEIEGRRNPSLCPKELKAG